MGKEKVKSPTNQFKKKKNTRFAKEESFGKKQIEPKRIGKGVYT